MNNKKGILIISDLHFAKDENNYSYLQEDNECYLAMVKAIKRENIEVEYLFVDGDLSDSGHKEEFNHAKAFLNKLSEEFGIKKENIMIVPGNHDFLRARCEMAENNGEDIDDYRKLNATKFTEFKEFYDDFFDKQKIFNVSDAIIDSILLESVGVLFLGINTVYKDSHRRQDHVGFIDEERLEKQLKEIDKRYPNVKKIALMHHHAYDDVIFGKGIANWNVASYYFERSGIEDFIFGHVHTSGGEAITTNASTKRFITCGALGKKDGNVDNTFRVLTFDESKKDILVNMPFQFMGHSYNPKKKYWQLMTNAPDEIDSIPITEIKGAEGLRADIRSFKDEKLVDLLSVDNYEEESIDTEIILRGNDYFDEVIRKEKLFMDGHFHWSQNGKSLSYLLTDCFFDDYKYFEKTKVCFDAIMHAKGIVPDLVIGYEMNGSILGVNLAIELKCDFTYITASRREYSIFEKRLPDDNKYRSIVVLVDILYKHYLINELVEQIKKKYVRVEKLFICSLFDDGNKKTVNDGITSCAAINHVPILPCDYECGKCPLEKKEFVDVIDLYARDRHS